MIKTQAKTKKKIPNSGLLEGKSTVMNYSRKSTEP
jgi:hypothetical protein